MSSAARWLGRVAASLILVLSALVFSSAVETGSALLSLLAADGVLGALLLIFGIERSGHPLAASARPVGWGLMFAFTLVPTSLLFLPALVVLLALPAVLGTRVRRGTGASASRAPGPS
jgi:hypothetical protein